MSGETEISSLGDSNGSSLMIYILEFLTAAIAFYLLYLAFPQHKLIWGMVYIAVVVSPKRDKSKSLIYDRIIANAIGAFVGFVILLFFKASLLSLCAGAVLIILFCNFLKMIDTARSALLPLIVVLMPEYKESVYVVALERILCVTLGCLTALAVKLLFDFVLLNLGRKRQGVTAKGD
jgi:uncharacterized membrane protein YgaE (UPF0421/DUF939 family)